MIKIFVVASLALFFTASVAIGDDCPDDRPIKKLIKLPVAPTAQACSTRLYCPANSDEPCQYIKVPCADPVTTIEVCITQDELTEAEKPKN